MYTFKQHATAGNWWVYDPRGYLHAGPFETQHLAQAEIDRLNWGL